MMSLSPPGQHQPVISWPFTNSGPWRELNPHLPGANRLSSPLDDTPRIEPVAPVGIEPTFPLFKRQVLRQLSYKALVQCVGQELNLHSICGWVTATWARQCPADTSCQYPGWDLNPCSSL